MLEVEIAVRAGAFRLEAAFAAPSSGTLALFGPSGAGKTTLLNALAGLVRPASGRIAIDERIFFSSKENINLPIEQRGLGYVFQEGRLFPHLSVAENLDYGARRATRRGGLPENGLHRHEVIDLLALEDLIQRRTSMLSGGERQRVAIGRALLAQPRLLLLDEPLAALDQLRKLEIMDYVERLRVATRIPIVLVSHAIEEVARLADFIVVLDRGHVGIAGPTPEVMTSKVLLGVVGQQQASSVIEGVVVDILQDGTVAAVQFAGGLLKLGARGRFREERVRIRIHASDVALALSEPSDISISNILKARVQRIDDLRGDAVLVVLDLNGVSLIASVTRESAKRLGLAPDLEVVALIKSVALIESNSLR